MLEVRELRPDELPAAWTLGRLAFGRAAGPPSPAFLEPDPATTRLGAVDERGRLLGKATDRHYRQSYGGRWVDAAGVAGVAVAPEARTGGVARALLGALVRTARERGAAVSPLFPTIPAVYRALGWEVVGSYASYRLPALALARVPVPQGVRLSAAEEADGPGIRQVYREVAHDTDGLLDRDGPLFERSDPLLLEGFDGLTVATGPGGAIEGYCSWDRGPGYDSGGRVTVSDLLAVTPDAMTALLAMLGSWAPVAPTLVLRLLDADAVSVPMPVTALEDEQRWMLRVLDAGRAVAQRGWPGGVRAAVDLDLVDPLVPDHAGAHRLVVEDGAGRWEAGGSGGLRLHVRALSALYGGGVRPTALRRAGLVEGDLTAMGTLDLLFARPRPQLLDYF